MIVKDTLDIASRSPQHWPVPGMAYFQFNDSLIEYYGEVVNGGIPMSQLNLPAGKIKRVFEKWSARALNSDIKLKKLYTNGD